MSIWNEELSREVALSQWRTHQLVLAVWIALIYGLPLLSGRSLSLLAFIQVFLLLVLPVALIMEFGRRRMNRDINEIACKWIWQK